MKITPAPVTASLHVSATALRGAAVLLLSALGAAAPAAAQPSAELPLWEVGAIGVGGRQPAYPGAADSVGRALVLPYVVYRGPLLRVDRGSAALRAFKTPDFELDVGFSGSLGSSSNDVAVRRGMPDLGTLIEFGPRLTWKLSADAPPGAGRWRVELPLRGVFDLSDKLAHRGLAFEPELSYARRTQGGTGYSVGVGAVWGNRRLTDTLYGVAPAYATASRPAYAAESGLIAWRLSASLSRQLAPDWRVFAFGRYDDVSGAANEASPLVQRRGGVSAGVGVAYTWMRSERRAVD